MSKEPHLDLSRRERQIMKILYRQGRATAAEIREQLQNKPSYSAVRAMLRILEEKGHIRHEEQSLRYVFIPIVPREKAKRSALRDLLETFFEGSTEKVVAALLDESSTRLSKEELDRLSRIIEEARREGD
jgi:predicted transcriptional regulator